MKSRKVSGSFLTKVSDTTKVSGIHLCLLSILMTGCGDNVSPYQDSNKSSHNSSGAGNGNTNSLTSAKPSLSSAYPISRYFSSTAHGSTESSAVHGCSSGEGGHGG
jgi:hypothetical protein